MSLRPTKRALGLAFGVLALFGVGTNVQAGWVLAVAAVLGGILVAGLVLPLRALSGLQVERLAPRATTARRPTTVTLRVTNTARRPRALIKLEDHFCGSGVAVIGLLPAGRTRELSGPRIPPRRGVYRSGRCVVTSGAPFGVLVVRKVLELPSVTVVHPPVFDTRTPERSGAVVTAHSGDVTGLREYRPGDPLRHVHWRSSARRGQLMVREHESVARGVLHVGAELPDDEVLGDAVASVACSIALGGLRDGLEVSLWPGVDGPVTEPAVLDWGARLLPAPPSKPLTEDGPRIDHHGPLIRRIQVIADPGRAAALAAEGAEVVLVGAPAAGSIRWGRLLGGSVVRSLDVGEVEALCGGTEPW